MRVAFSVLRPCGEELVVVFLAEPPPPDAVGALGRGAPHSPRDRRLVQRIALCVALVLDPRELIVGELVEVRTPHLGDVRAHRA
eukprot:CAMPEP_0184404372 /NCGR_PEP_ID=MMETSP0007-20130409/85901_1 /TAXON_ID=97485 /ORGANISM="Prymnesium parvum, Strain Texoma1" /LENGTH=83 /DNA_ID=CAMNT_0026760517 /DNA_START=1016 /DNA_END=1264 /DNA_ORIENTATION=+